MIVGNYNKELFCDDMLIKVLSLVNDKVTHNNDDALIINIGLTGSGKSTLSAIQYYHIATARGITPDAEKIVLTMQGFAENIGKIEQWNPQERIIIYDELELSKRNSMTKWNKDIISLYSKIRGLNCVHIWNHPSLEMIDKAFIQERINGVFFIFDKHKDKPRRYLFFRKKDILSLLGKHKKLHLEVLKEHGREHAFYMGFFGRYDGLIMERYKQIKHDGMKDAIMTFQKKYGEKKKRNTKSSVLKEKQTIKQ